MEQYKVNIAIMTMITMMITCCVQACGLNTLVVSIVVKACDIWEGIATTRGESQVENIRFLGFWNMKRRSDIMGFKVYVHPNGTGTKIYYQLPIPLLLSKMLKSSS